MSVELSRRGLCLGAAAAVAEACTPSPRPAAPPAPTSARAHAEPKPPPPAARAAIEAIEAQVGGRVGVFALDTGSGHQVEHRADERFAMCSTFKWALVAAVLARVDRGELSLGERVTFAESEVLEYAPLTRKSLGNGSDGPDRGTLSLEALAEAAITISDNTAANLLLARIDGPRGMTEFFRRAGDDVTRLDRDEPTLNTNLPDDPRDTTSPRAMVGAMKRVLLGDVLSRESRERLLGWMKASQTGLERLRKGLPADWMAGDKTGTGNRGAANDLCIAWPPGRAPILIAAYLSDGTAELPRLNAAHAKLAEIVVASLASPGEQKRP
ncbi:MAG: class A beta-lactamase [Polyangiaceae bacterium]